MSAENRPRAAAVAVVWLVAALPFASGAVRCPTATLFHFACPGCGMTRALLALARGDVAASLAMHPLAAPTAGVQIALAIATVLVTLRRGAPWAIARTRGGRAVLAATALVLAADVVLWVVRLAGGLGGPVPV